MGFVFLMARMSNYNYDHHVIVEHPSKSGSIPELIFPMKSVIKRGCSDILLKKRNTAFWATTYTVVWLESMYKKLLLVSKSTFRAQRSIFRIRISALAKTVFVGSSADSTLLKHAYTTHPYCSTLDTSALTNCNLTRTFEIPNNLQLDLIAWNVLLALLILACNMPSGLVQLFYKIRPRYLNLSTTVIFLPLTCNLPVQFTYMASVFEMLISKSFSSQKVLKQFSSDYNS
jgi:hypothetical protein